MKNHHHCYYYKCAIYSDGAMKMLQMHFTPLWKFNNWEKLDLNNKGLFNVYK